MTTSPAPLGPFFDYSARLNFLMKERNSCARICTQSVLSGRMSEAQHWAEEYRQLDVAMDALEDWFESWRNTDARWVGFDGYSRARAVAQ